MPEEPTAAIPAYGEDPRWDAYYDAAGNDWLWSQPAPPILWQLFGARWFKLPILPWVWRRIIEPVRYRAAWWLWTRRHYYPTQADWLHD